MFNTVAEFDKAIEDAVARVHPGNVAKGIGAKTMQDVAHILEDQGMPEILVGQNILSHMAAYRAELYAREVRPLYEQVIKGIVEAAKDKVANAD